MGRLSLLTVLAAAVCASGQTPNITANSLKADVSFLASDALEGRGTPSRGLDIAAEYIAAQFRRAGLEPAGDGGYFQTATFASDKANTAGLELSFDIGGRTIKADPASLRIDQPTALDLTNAPAFVANSSETYAALTPGQVAGKVLVLVIPANNSNLRVRTGAFSAMHPAAIITLRANGQGPTFGSRLRDASDSAPAPPALTVWDPAVLSAFETSGPTTVTLHVPAPEVTSIKLRNVVGILRGSDPSLKDTYMLLTAHYDHLGIRGTGPGDHIFNGANDDASGTASVIEIANALAALPQHPKRSIVFIALFGEELGDLGSRYYARHPVFPLARTIGDVNLEQVGRTDDQEGPRVGMFNLTGFDFTDMPAVFRKAGEETGIKVVKDEMNSDPFFTRSDNAAFAQAGIPSTTISVSYVYPDYHGAADEWPKLDYENMAKVDRTIALAVYSMADSTTEPKWNEANPKVEAFVKAQKALSSKP